MKFPICDAKKGSRGTELLVSLPSLMVLTVSTQC